MTLLKLRNGESSRLVNIDKAASCYDRLMELGFIHGEEITVLRKAPLGGPIQVEVRDTHYAICRTDAQYIHVA